MHLKTPKHLQQMSKLSKLRAYFYKRWKIFTKCACQKVFSRLVNWLKKLLKKKKMNKKFFNWKLILKEEYFSNLNKQISKLNSSF